MECIPVLGIQDKNKRKADQARICCRQRTERLRRIPAISSVATWRCLSRRFARLGPFSPRSCVADAGRDAVRDLVRSALQEVFGEVTTEASGVGKGEGTKAAAA